MTERIIWRWIITQGLAFHDDVGALDRMTDRPWTDWTDWAAHLDLSDRNGSLVATFDNDPDTDPTGLITLEDNGTFNVDILSAVTAAMTSTATIGRGKEKAQLVGTIYLTDPLYPSEPYPVWIVKAVVKEA